MDKNSDYYGEGGRLSSSAKYSLINSAYKHDCDDAEILLPGMHKADLAYASMLIEEKLIPKKEGIKLIKGLLKLENIPISEFPINPEFGDVYNSKDVALRNIIGDTAGWIHMGRPRREAVNIGYIIATRENLIDLFATMERLASIMLKKAIKHKDTLMPDFTYLHHAQPTVFGHYIMTFIFPLLRDFQRFREAFSKLNMSPAGSGSVNGSRLSLNRNRLEELLNFEGMSNHTRDAMWQVDVPIEIMSSVVIMMTNLSRFAEELQIWNTAEFNMVLLPDDLCRASVIMPQKKNPYPLAYFRGLTSSLIGLLPSFASYGKIYSGNPDSRIFIYGDLPRAIKKSKEAVELLADVIDRMEVNKDLLQKRIDDGFTFATDLAEIIVESNNIEYRTAHKIVGAVVRDMLENNYKGKDLHIDILNKYSKDIIKTEIDITQDALEIMLNPRNIVKSRITSGGASEEEMKKMFNIISKDISNFIAWVHSKYNLKNFEKLKYLTEGLIKND